MIKISNWVISSYGLFASVFRASTEGWMKIFPIKRGNSPSKGSPLQLCRRKYG
ncbi:hypothetical protein BB560_003521, partial [Smittium megazygosporum]